MEAWKKLYEFFRTFQQFEVDEKIWDSPLFIIKVPRMACKD